MKILMLAPEPVFRPRGTPFSVRDRCRVLGELGHSVDLLTYPFGESFEAKNVQIHRTCSIFGIKDVKIGFSVQKIPLDLLLFFKAFRSMKRNRYDLIHTHEEAGMMGAILGKWFRTPHLYDMHSSLPQQFENYMTTNSSVIMSFMNWAERYILMRSEAVIAICENLKSIALKNAPNANVHVIENLSQTLDSSADPSEADRFRAEHRLQNKFVIGYTGTFEVNQGLDILVEAFSKFHQAVSDSALLLVGGEISQIERIRDAARVKNIDAACIFTGKMPVERMASIMKSCDVLASPRIIGTNTPLKIYSYLWSGVPILATRLLTHTQVLDDNTAILTEPVASGLERGMHLLFNDVDLRKRIGAAAQQKERENYSYSAYKKRLEGVIWQIEFKRKECQSSF